MTVCTILSDGPGIPSGLIFPFFLGMYTLLMGLKLYVWSFSFWIISLIFVLENPSSVSSSVPLVSAPELFLILSYAIMYMSGLSMKSQTLIFCTFLNSASACSSARPVTRPSFVTGEDGCDTSRSFHFRETVWILLERSEDSAGTIITPSPSTFRPLGNPVVQIICLFIFLGSLSLLFLTFVSWR